jgi:hypothetical protein
MSNDYSTSTVSGAAAHAAKFADPVDPHEGWDGDIDVPDPDLSETRTSTWEELYQFLHNLRPHQRRGYITVLVDPKDDEVYAASGVAVACDVAEHLWSIEEGELILCLES